MSIGSLISAYCPAFLRPALNRITKSPIGYRIAHGVFWSMAGAVISRSMGLVAWVLVARILGKAGYGEWGIIQSTVGMFGVFAGFGMGLTATKHVAEYRQNDPDRAGRIIALSAIFTLITGGLMALGLFIFAPWLAEHTINAPHLAGVLRLSAMVLLISAMNGAQIGALSGFEAFKTTAHINLFVGIISFPIILAGVYFGGLSGVVLAVIINSGVNWLLNHLALRREAHRYKVPFTFKHCTREMPILWRFSFPAVLGSVVTSPINWSCGVLLVNQPDGYGEMGLFRATFNFQMIILFAGTMLNGPLLSILSHSSRQVSDRLGRFNILLSWVIAIMLITPLLCFPEIAELLFGKEYSGRQFRMTFALVMLYTCVIMYKQGLARVLAANSLMWWGFLSNSIWAVVLISSAWFLVHWGAIGLALSYLIAYAVNTLVIMPVYFRKKLIPSDTLISKYTLTIWLTLFSLFGLSYWDVPIVYKAVCFVLAAAIICYCLMKIFRPAGRKNA